MSENELLNKQIAALKKDLYYAQKRVTEEAQLAIKLDNKNAELRSVVNSLLSGRRKGTKEAYWIEVECEQEEKAMKALG